MAKQEPKTDRKRVTRNFPVHSIEEALVIGQKISDEMAGKPLKRLLLAEALGIKPSSTNYRDLLSSSFKYGLTEGTEKATDIELKDLGQKATQTKDPTARMRALQNAVLTPPLYSRFFNDYSDKKLPTQDFLDKILVAEYEVPSEFSSECAEQLVRNGRFVGLIRDIGGSPHVILEDPRLPSNPTDETQAKDEHSLGEYSQEEPETTQEEAAIKDIPSVEQKSKPIFIAHGKNKEPLKKLQEFLTRFQIPYKVATEEANLGRPISGKVKQTMEQCGSAILIFTCDEKLLDANGTEIWRPSENVIHELGAASFAYDDRIVIFKEVGLNFPTNFKDIGYIEFDEDSIDAKTADLLQELVGFGLVRVTPA